MSRKKMTDLEKYRELGLKSELKNSNFKWFNPNPDGEVIGDCAVRALTKAEDVPYETVERELLSKLNEVGYRYYSKIAVIYLNDKYERIIIPKPKRGEKRMTIGMFAKLHPIGRYVLHASHHLTSVVDSIHYDNADFSACTCYTAWRIK